MERKKNQLQRVQEVGNNINYMELEEFIKITLVSIKKGVTEANKDINLSEGKTMGKDGHMYFSITRNNHENKEGFIAFDIALTVSKESKTSGGAKIKIAVAGLGGDISDLSSQENITRVKFHISPSLTIG